MESGLAANRCKSTKRSGVFILMKNGLSTWLDNYSYGYTHIGNLLCSKIVIQSQYYVHLYSGIASAVYLSVNGSLQKHLLQQIKILYIWLEKSSYRE